MAKLPRDRQSLLVAWADLSYAEVAEALAIPVGTVRSRLTGRGPGCAAPSATTPPSVPTARPSRERHRHGRPALLREFRAEAPASAPADLWPRAVRATDGRGARRRPHLRGPLVAVGALATVAAVVGALVVAPGSTPPSAAAVLDRAALALADAPAPRTRVRTSGSSRAPCTSTRRPARPERTSATGGRGWTARWPPTGCPDGRLLVQGLESWPLGTPAQWYDVVSALPEQPADVLQYLRDDPLYESRGASQADRDFDEVTQALTSRPSSRPPAGPGSTWRSPPSRASASTSTPPRTSPAGRCCPSPTPATSPSAARATVGAAARPVVVRRPRAPGHRRIGHRPGRHGHPPGHGLVRVRPARPPVGRRGRRHRLSEGGQPA